MVSEKELFQKKLLQIFENNQTFKLDKIEELDNEFVLTFKTNYVLVMTHFIFEKLLFLCRTFRYNFVVIYKKENSKMSTNSLFVIRCEKE